MNRRLMLLMLTLSLFPGAGLARAEQSKFPVLGILASAATPDDPVFGNLRDSLRLLGYVEGKNIKIEFRSALGQIEKLTAIAEELVRLKPDAILVLTPIGAQALKKATATIPIVIALNDLVGLGLVANLARPGGNITGPSSITTELHGKRLQLLRDAIPRLARVAILQNVSAPVTKVQDKAIEDLQAAASMLSIELQIVRITKLDELESAFAAIGHTRAQAIYLIESPLFYAQRAALVGMVSKSHLPAIYGAKAYPDEGGLMSFGVSYTDEMRRAAVYIDKILKGAKPGDLPIEQPSKFEVVVNLKTARRLGITIPETILVRADEVIR